MNLIIDAGNTQIKWAVYSLGKQIFKSSVNTWKDFLPEDCFLNFPDIKSAIISSVRHIPEEFSSHIEARTLNFWKLDHKLQLPIKIRYKNPETLGKDRIAAAVGGTSIYPGKPILIIDIGTAITFDFVNKNSEFLGGNISPGMRLRFKALSQFTEDLPEVYPAQNIPLFGQSTIEAIQSGVQTGINYEIDAHINALINKYNGLRTILTGGDASFFVRNLKNTIFVVPDLVLDGLNLILEYQKDKNRVEK